MYAMTTVKLQFDLLDNETVRQAIERVGGLASKNDIEWALAGGSAVVLYGSRRLTKEIDIIASRTLPLPSCGLLKQGGVRYIIPTDKADVPVDWIIRNDEAKAFYRSALNDAVLIGDLPVLKPEWLVILKYISGRFKDREDCVYLLSCPNLVDRKKIKEIVSQIGGNAAWAVMKYGLQRWYDIADGRTEPDNDGFIDS